jgi:hypothetical protein
MKIHPIEDYNNHLIETFNKLSIAKKYKIIGSSSLKPTLYFNDYDLNEYFKSDSKNILNKITSHFKTLFKETYNNPDAWIIDFKCGIDPNYDKDELSMEDGYKLRWSRQDINKGYKVLRDGTKKYFKDCILDKTIMKIDYILLLNGAFTEISENYELSIDGVTNIITNIDLKKELQKDIVKYKNENKMKSLKREFSLLREEGKNPKKRKKLLEIFNSEYGYLNKIINNLSTILLMLEQSFRPVHLEDIYNNLQLIKQQLSYFNTKSLSDEIDSLCKIKKKIIIFNSLQKIINYLQNYLNKELS